MARWSKLKCQRRHARRRFRERTGLNFSEKKERAFISKIQNNEAQLLENQSQRVGLYKVNYEGTDYKVVYDRNRKVIVTVLI